MAFEVTEQARRLHADALVWDMVWPWEPWLDNGFNRLKDIHAAGTDVLSLTIAGDNHTMAEAIGRIAETRAGLAQNSDSVLLCENMQDIKFAHNAGKLAVLLHFEGTRCFERRLDMVEVCFKLGIKHTLLCFNNANSAAGGLMEQDDAGLTHFGRQLIAEMERVGMLLDLSHVGHRSAREAMDLSTRPCLFTHSNVHALHPHPRNLSDEEMKACAATGGLIGIASSSMYFQKTGSTTESLFTHLDHMVELLGPEHVGLGLDQIFNPGPMNDWMRTRPGEWPDAAKPGWPGIHTIQLKEIPELTQRMLNAGYAEEDIRKILGGNYVRIATEAWG